MFEIAAHNEQLEALAHDIVGSTAQKVPMSNAESFFEAVVGGMKGNNITEKLTVHTVKYNEDGTTTVTPQKQYSSNASFLKNYLENGNSIMISNEQGDALCFAAINVGGTNYIQSFMAKDAEALRERLSARIQEPKELSFYDKVCDFFANLVYKRPGKAVQAYNEQKLFNESVRNMINNMSNIPEDVEGYRQATAQERFDEHERQEELERQRQLEEEARQKALQEEEARLKAEAELKQQEEQKLKQQKAEEEKELKAQQLKDALTKQQPEEVTQSQIKEINDAYTKLPKLFRKQSSTAEVKNKNLKDVNEKEQQLKTVKSALENDKKALEKVQGELKEANDTVKEAKKALKQMDDLKVFTEKKAAETNKLDTATKDVQRFKNELSQERTLNKQLKAEYDAEKGNEFYYKMTPEQYIHQEHVKNSEGRKKAYEETRKMTVLKDMEEVQREIDLVKSGKASVNAESSWLDRAWGISSLRTKGKAMHDLDDKVAALEEVYAELQAQDAENLKAFQQQEEIMTKLERDFSPENIKVASNFLKANIEKGKAKYDAYHASSKRISELNTKISKGNKTIKEAETELKILNNDPLNNYKYDATEHQQLKTRVPNIENQIKETLTPLIKNLTKQVNDRQRLVDGAESQLEVDRKMLNTLTQSANEAEVALSQTVNKLVHNANLLNKRGLAIPQPPEDVQPYLKNMLSFQLILGEQQGQQAQQVMQNQQMQQGQPKPMGMGGPNG